MAGSLKTIFKHAAIYGIAPLAGKAIGFLLIPLYTHYLTPKDYGIVELLSAFIVLAGIVVQGGITAAVFKFYNSYTDKRDKDEVLGTVLAFVTLAALGFCLLSSIFAPAVSYAFLKDSGYGYFVILMLGSFFFSTVANIPETYLMAEKKSKIFSFVSIGTLIVNLALNIYFVAVVKRGVEGILYASLLARFINAGGLLMLMIPKTGFRVCWKKIGSILRFSIPLIPTELGMFAFGLSDRIFLSHFADLRSVGLYSLGSKFAFMISLLLIQPLMQTWQQEMYEVKRRVDAPCVFGNVFTCLVGLIAVSGVVLSICIKEVILLMADPQYLQAWRVVPVIALAYIFRFIYLFFQMGMLFESKTGKLSLATTLGAAVILAMNFLWIPRYAEMGAAAAYLSAYLVLAGITLPMSQQLYRIHIEVSRLFKLAVVVLIVYAGYQFISIQNVILSLLIKTTCLPALALALWIVGFLREEEIKEIRRVIFARSAA